MRTSAISASSAKDRQDRQGQYTLHKVTKITKSTDPLSLYCSGDPSTKQSRGATGFRCLHFSFLTLPSHLILAVFGVPFSLPCRRLLADTDHGDGLRQSAAAASAARRLLGVFAHQRIPIADTAAPAASQVRQPQPSHPLSARAHLHSHTQPGRTSAYRCRTLTSVSCAQSAQSAHAGEARR